MLVISICHKHMLVSLLVVFQIDYQCARLLLSTHAYKYIVSGVL